MSRKYYINYDCDQLCKPNKDITLVTPDCKPMDEALEFDEPISYILSELLPQNVTENFDEIVTKYCEDYKKPQSAETIVEFIKQFDIDWRNAERCRDLAHYAKDDENKMLECAKRFKNKDDFFTRELNPDYVMKYARRTGKELTDKIILSPAECRTVVYENAEQAKQIWIKGKYFSIDTLLNLTIIQDENFLAGLIRLGKELVPNEELRKKLEKIVKERIMQRLQKVNVLISRLSPADYHRYHSPVSGRIIYIDEIAGKYLDTHPMIIHTPVDVFVRNKRTNVWIWNNDLRIVIVCLIGATCVSSINLTLPDDPDKKVKKEALIGKRVKQGDQLGFFEYGGSTIVTIIPGKINWCKKLLDLSLKGIELYVHIKEYLGEKN